MDVLLDLFEEDGCEDEENDDEEIDIPSNNRNKSNGKQPSSRAINNTNEQTADDIEQSAQDYGQINEVSISVDERIGIRMINRKVCGTDLLSMICEYPYHSPAQLSAMSLQQLNTQVLDAPTAILDIANVFGKTKMMTIGLVFSNSGTRIASSGNAFCIVQIGSNFRTGPTVSMLLFGNCYSTYCKSIVPGKVIAIQNPRLMPINNSAGRSNKCKSTTDYTSISFSVNDPDQIKIIADAQDYGVCKGTVSSKNQNGHWVANSKRCCQYVDTRICDYCPVHLKQQQQQSSMTCKPVATATLQQLRKDSQVFPTHHRGMISTSLRKQSINGLPHPHEQEIIRRGTFLEQLTAQVNAATDNKNIVHRSMKNSILNSKVQSPHVQHIVNNNSIHSSSAKIPTKPQNFPSNIVSVKNPRPILSFEKQNLGLDLCSVVNRSNIISREQPPKTSNQSSNKLDLDKVRKRKQISNINTDTSGFDGSVLVPKPSKILHRLPGQSMQDTMLASSRRTSFLVRPTPDEIQATRAMTKQQVIAERMRENNKNRYNNFTGNGKENGSMKTNASRTNWENSSLFTSHAVATKSREDLLYGSLKNIDHDAIIAKSSRFANDVDAEEYARRRRIVMDLEVAESKKENNSTNDKKTSSSKKNNTNSKGAGIIIKEYHCKTCGRFFNSSKKPPIQCIRQKHVIVLRRKIMESKGIAEQRQSLTEKDVVDGGLKLASGLDWSKWNRG